ncbi:MAG: hypothetical protein KatS3mg076_3023 [Candidatus Binatia bacterium]|nr:MAG: hypothetical protein KatS3mg076_3023 [Candidatus Binatia bacterium]
MRAELLSLFTTTFPTEEPGEAILELVRKGLGGVILFSRHAPTPERLLHTVRRLKRESPGRLVVSVDQEGGRVARLRGDPWAPLPAMRRLGELDPAEGERKARILGELVARELRAVGIDLDFAPVLDVDTNPRNPVIGDRSFSGDARVVARLGVAFLRGLQENGVAACGKHFPGHGEAAEDSHETLPRVELDRARLLRVELRPFRAAVRAGVASIMTAHVLYPALDSRRPATLSPAVLSVLRERLRFAGVVVSDDLSMRAVADSWSVGEAAAQGLAAGCDHFLVCQDPRQVVEAVAVVERELRKHPSLERRLARALLRWSRLRERYARSAPEPGEERWLFSEEHRRLAASAAAGD